MALATRRHPIVRKARFGWWVDGYWCPTMRTRDFLVGKLWTPPA